MLAINEEEHQRQWEELYTLSHLHSVVKHISNEHDVRMTLHCIKLFNKDVIEISQLAKIVHQGFGGDTTKMRGIVWRLLLGYLPPQKKSWHVVLDKNKCNYDAIVVENVKKQPPAKSNDHPLSRSTDSNWNNYFKDQQLWIQIHKDIVRTRQKDFIAMDCKDILTKILFLWCKLNKTIYIQGMNEIAAIIYYALASDNTKCLRDTSESDAFYCFSILMSSMKQNFMGFSEESLLFKEKVRYFSELLKKIDRKLYDHLVGLKINFTIFCIKWFLTSLAQDLSIQDALRIWDTLLCQQDQATKDEFLYFICISILLFLREDLVNGEFGEVIMKLQNLEAQNLDMDVIIQKAYLLQKEHRKT